MKRKRLICNCRKAKLASVLGVLVVLGQQFGSSLGLIHNNGVNSYESNLLLGLQNHKSATSSTANSISVNSIKNNNININNGSASGRRRYHHHCRRCLCRASYSSSNHNYEIEIAVSTIAFATTHIGMSAIRRNIINRIGKAVETIGWVGTGMKLPDIWPGDEVGGQEIFPTSQIAGRQLYRVLYTIISFSTLGYGFYAYLNSLALSSEQQQQHTIVSLSTSGGIGDNPLLCNAVAAMSWGISIASLINPSPFSLVPVYEQATKNFDRNEEEQNRPIRPVPTPKTTTNNNGIRRNDSRKLIPYGLTRITRHPLILPVVPWGIATAEAMGGHLNDYLFFGILSLYAIAGCAAQDLRVVNEEGSIGTVFINPDDPSKSLQSFFEETSFVPFQALIEGRQSIEDVIQEVPWWALVIGTAIGYQIQQSLLQFLIHYK